MSIIWVLSNPLTSLPCTVLQWPGFGNDLPLHLWGLLVTLQPLRLQGHQNAGGSHTNLSRPAFHQGHRSAFLAPCISILYMSASPFANTGIGLQLYRIHNTQIPKLLRQSRCRSLGPFPHPVHLLFLHQIDSQSILISRFSKCPCVGRGWA